MAHIITLPVEWTTEEIDDSVWGNSALAYPWWSDLEPGADDNNDLIVCGQFGSVEDGDELQRFSVTFDDWLRALREVALEYQGWRAYIIDKDIDADLGDMILQVAVAGKVIYS